MSPKREDFRGTLAKIGVYVPLNNFFHAPCMVEIHHCMIPSLLTQLSEVSREPSVELCLSFSRRKIMS